MGLLRSPAGSCPGLSRGFSLTPAWACCRGMLPMLLALSAGGAAHAGTIVGVMNLAGLTAPFWGHLADRRGLHRQVLVAGLLMVLFPSCSCRRFSLYRQRPRWQVSLVSVSRQRTRRQTCSSSRSDRERNGTPGSGRAGARWVGPGHQTAATADRPHAVAIFPGCSSAMGFAENRVSEIRFGDLSPLSFFH
jgi:hypothetical protein